MPKDINIFGGHSIFALKDSIKKINSVSSTNLTFNNKPILNSTNVLDQILKWIQSGTAENAFCMICFNDFNKNNLKRVCGRKSCISVSCNDCMKQWYGENKIGHRIQVNSLTCPFCKQYPSCNILSRYNKQLCTMILNNQTFDINWWYGWCSTCSRPKKFVEKSCSIEAPNLNGQFICEDCQVIIQPDDSKQCPNSQCGVAIMKNGGCNHMECTACKKHFCWICADVSYDTSQETYDHLYKNHGGAFGNNENYYSDDDYSDDDYSDDDDY